jgi:general secretion pathway protein K
MRRASALILALWALFFLAALAVAVGSQVSGVLSLAGALRSRVIARSLACAGVEFARSEWRARGIEAVTNAPALFASRDELAGGAFSVSYEVVGADGTSATNCGVRAESEKLNLNRARTTDLASLLVGKGGVAPGVAEAIAAAIVDWRDPDSAPLTGGAEDQYYSTLTDPYRCRNGPFGLVEELLLVKGVDAAVFARIRPYVTVYGEGAVGATASGFALGGGMTTACVRIDFVCDRDGRKRFWHEY